MGSCVSVQKNPESAVELRLSIDPKTDNFSTAPPAKPEPETVTVANLAAKSGLSSRFRDSGSKDDSFFDSQPWLESDCEDDFMSVNGDFTPSRGNTPVHPKFSSGNPKANNVPAVEKETFEKVVEPPVPEKNKRLSDLFNESLRHVNYVDEGNEASVENVEAEAITLGQSKSTNGIEAKSMVRAKDEPVMSTQCCLPSFSDRKKKTRPALMIG